MEEEYTVIKSQSKIQDNQATMKFLLIMNVLMMLPGLMSGIQIEFYIGAASIGLIVFLFIIQRWIKSYVQLITILLLLSYSVTRYVVVDKNYEAAIKGVLFFNGYSVASTQFIIMSRLHNVYLRILAGFIAYGLRIGVLVGIVDHRLLTATLLIRQFIIDAFIVYMFYSNDKVDRRIFQNYYENREELVKFKELLADSLPQSVTILDAKTQKPLFCNNFFANTFSLSPNNQLDTDVAHDNLTRDDAKPSLSSLRVDIHTIRETHSTEGYLVLKSFSSSSPYLEEVLERLLEENTLESKTLSLTAAYKHETQRRLFEIIFKKIRWDRVEAVAVILNDITYQENLLTLKVANKNKDKLIATVSHELRTPLHGIIGVLQTIEKKQEGKEVAEYLSLCKNHAYLLLSLVNSIVDFHQIETGKLRLNPARVEIRTALREFLKPFEFQCKAKNIQLEMEVDKDVPTYIITDENRLNQIFVNLLNNAVKFTFYGRIKIEASQDPKNINCLLISVRDTGIGIKGQDLGYLFKTSKTWGDKESVGKSGVGLGLTMSNTLALLLNGRKDGIGIEVDSEYGKGSCFSFRILKNLDAFQELEFQIGKEVEKEEQFDEREHNEMEKKKKISWNREVRKYEQDEDSIESNYYERSNLSVDLKSKMASYLSLRKGGNQDVNDQINSFKTSNNEKLTTPKDAKLLPRNESLDNYGLFTLEQVKPGLQEPTSSLQLFQNECILVVDDYPFNLLVAKNLLKNFGYTIKVAMGGQEAIETVKICSQNGQTIKVILMDCQMPVIDGYETTRILIDLMNKKEIPKIPILAWTANNSEEDIQRCYESGMVGHLSKPTSQDALKNALEKLPNR